MSQQDFVYNNREEYVSELMNPIKVLVVDHRNDWVAYVSDLLHSSFFEVTHVKQFFEASTLLSKKENEYDLLLISHDMTNVDIHTFLRQIIDMNVLSIVMSDQQDDAFVLDVFKSGAFLVLKTPLTIDALMHIRQDAIRERMYKHGNSENKKMSHKKLTQEIVQESSSESGNDSFKKRIWIEWTSVLCEKFDDAVTQLEEEGKCYPSEIHKLMNVPGLTKRQVASHLQKFKNKLKKSKDKEMAPTSSKNQSFYNNLLAQEVNKRKYGSISPIETFEADQNGASNLNGIDLSVNDVNNILNQTDVDSSSLMSPLTYGNGFGSNQHEGFGSQITATTGYPQAISGMHDAWQGVEHHRFSTNQQQAYDDFLIYLDGNGLNRDMITESFTFGQDHVLQKEDTSGPKMHI